MLKILFGLEAMKEKELTINNNLKNSANLRGDIFLSDT